MPLSGKFPSNKHKQYVLVALQYEEASSYSILIKCNVSNFTLRCPIPCMWAAVAPFAPSLDAPVTV